MRTLHSIARHEKLLARGQYSIMYDGQQDGLLEKWNLHAMPYGSRVLRADVINSADGADSYSLIAHLLSDSDGHPDRLHVRSEIGDWKAEVQVTFFPSYATVSRSVKGEKYMQPEIDLPENVVVVAPCQSSNALGSFDENKGKRQTMDILSFGASWISAEQFAPRLQSVAIELRGTAGLKLEGSSNIEAQKFAEGDSSIAYLDQHGMLLRRETPDGAMLSQMQQYARYDT